MQRSRSLRTTTRVVDVDGGPGRDVDAVWSVVAGAGPGPHWYADAAAFRFRAGLDRLAGGDGAPWPAPERALLETGDRAGFWRVVAAEHGPRRHLLLQAAVRAPGVVRLDVVAEQHDAGTRLRLTISLQPDGVLGWAYLLADLPAREVVTETVTRRLLADVA